MCVCVCVCVCTCNTVVLITIAATGTGVCSASIPIVPLPSSIYLQSNQSTYLASLHSPLPPSVSPSSLSLSFLSLALIILGTVLVVTALFVSIFITIHCRMKAKNSSESVLLSCLHVLYIPCNAETISSIILSPTTQVSK